MANIGFGLLEEPVTRKPSKLRIVLFILFILLLISSVVFIALYVLEKTKSPESERSRVSGTNTTSNSSSASKTCTSPACIASAADILSNFDQSTEPCDDFYQFSCGGFLKKTFVQYGQLDAGPDVDAANYIQYFLKDRLANEQLMSSYSKDPDSAVYKAFKFYKSCINESAILSAGVEPFLNMIEKYGSWNITNKNWTGDTWILEKVLARMAVDLNTKAFLEFDVVPYTFDTSQIFVAIGGGTSARSRKLVKKDELKRASLILPEIEKPDELNTDRDDQYTNLMSTVFKVLAAASSINKSMDEEVERINQLEKEFDKIKDDRQIKPAELKNFTKFMTLKELNSFTSFKFNWTMYLEEAFRGTGKSIHPDQTLWILHPNNTKKIVDFISSQPKSLLANEIMWNAIRGLLGQLPKSFIDKYQSVVQTTTATTPRWKTCNSLAQQFFAHVTTLLYVKEHVSDDSLNSTSEMFTEIKNQFIDGLKEQEWMDSATRAEARLKLDRMKKYIGYPPIVKDSIKLNTFYRNVKVDMSRYVQNLLNVFKFLHLQKLKNFGKTPDDVNFLGSSPLEINAFYKPTENALAICAARLQPPFYRDGTLNALNYGALGMVVGHEITHGFDTTGSLYDESGSYRSWWTKKSHENFVTRSNCLIKQYSKITVDGGLQVNGRKTVGENIADNGGIKYAFRAYQKWRDIHGNETKLPAIPYNNDQLFFIGFAQQWCKKYTEAAIKWRLKNDVHALNDVRVRVTLHNFPEFSQAFGCKPPAPEDTCTVW